MSVADVQSLRAAIAAFNDGGVEAALEYLDPSVQWIGPSEWLEDRVYEGYPGVRRLASLWIENFDEFRLDLERVIDAGDRAIALIIQRGRIKGSGDEIEQQIGYEWETRDGKGVRIHVHFSWEAALAAAELAE
jgi:ketosteroid isomerase-like protein